MKFSIFFIELTDYFCSIIFHQRLTAHAAIPSCWPQLLFCGQQGSNDHFSTSNPSVPHHVLQEVLL